MKAFVFLLLLANLLFYAFSEGYFGRPENPDAGRTAKQVAPEKMRVVSRGEAPLPTEKVSDAAPANLPPPEPAVEPPANPSAAVVPAGAVTEPPAPVVAASAEKPEKPEAAVRAEAPPVCLAWEPLSLNEAEQIGAMLGVKQPGFKVSKKVTGGESNGWWVFIPPLASKADVDKKTGELRQFGITDYFVVQEGTSRNAISLGVFSTEKGAQDRLAQLKEEGVRSARVMPRPGKDSTITLQASGPASARAAVVASVAKIAPRRGALACK